MGKIYGIVVMFFLMFPAFGQVSCDFWYVSPTGTGTVGTPDQPVSLTYALSNITPTRNHVRVLGGTYNFTNTLSLVSDVIIEGGYQVSGSDWVLSSNVNSNIDINPPVQIVNVGGTDVGNYVGMEASNLTGFVLRNLNINVKLAGATGTTTSRGRNVYGVYLNGSSNYKFSRVVINTGDGSDGLAGASGAAGVQGANGNPGQNGDCDGCFWPWCSTSGAPGGAGGLGGGGTLAGQVGTSVNGGGGGKGGNGGVEGANAGQAGQEGGGVAGSPANTTGGGAGGSGGNPGGNGTNGAAGVNGTAGSNGASAPAGAVANGYFIPGAQGLAGANGIAGKGGRGGGGGGGQGCSLCDDGPGNAGGAGAGGGQAGAGGTGGFGGGSSYGVFAWSNGSNGVVMDSEVNPGDAGDGGAGGAGGLGAAGGTGGAGASVCLSEIGRGGNGGAGGSGGAGGIGAAGAAGVSQAVIANGTAVTVTGTSVPSAFSPVTVLQRQGCTNSEILLTKNGGSFDLTAMGGAQFVNDLNPSATSYTLSSNNVSVFYSTIGVRNVVVGGTTYNEYLSVVTSRPLPVAEVLVNATPVTTVCAFSTVALSTPTSGSSFEWSIVNGTTAIQPSGGATGATSSHTFGAPGMYHVRLRVKDDCCGWSIPVYQEITVTAGPTVDLGQDTTICGSNTITFDAGPGFSSYLWSPSGDVTQTTTANNTGIYTVVVTDANGCTGQDQVQVGVSAPLNIIVTPDGPTSFCVGEDVVLSSNSGFSSYLWSDGVSSSETLTVTQTGEYYVVVEDYLGCSGISQVVQVTVHSLPNAAIAPSGPLSFCPGDSVVLNAPLGYPQYDWSTGSSDEQITVSTSGPVSLSVYNTSGCVNSSTVNVQVYPQPNPVISASGPLSFCYGDNVVLSLNGPYASYLWSSGSTTPFVTVFEAGQYGVTVIDVNGCVDSTLLAAPVVVTVYNPQPEVVQSGDSLIVTNANDFGALQWHLNGSPIVGATGSTHVITATGNYTVIGTDDNGCSGISNNYEMTCCVGIVEHAGIDYFNIYPNPSKGIYQLEVDFVSNRRYYLKITDMSGRIILANQGITDGSRLFKQLDLSAFTTGVYLLQLTTDEDFITARLIKQ